MISLKSGTLPASTIKQINRLVEIFKEKETRHRFEAFAKQVYNLLSEHPKLTPHIHSLKYRIKDPERLYNKLCRKAIESKEKGNSFDINPGNLFEKIEDLAGVRILHLHTEQMIDINVVLKEIFEEERYNLIDGPIANTWDNEYRDFFRGLSMHITERDTMYTSVHYVIGSNNKYQTRCELQVRTLMEEVWGEVSHEINYPEQTNSVACQEQIKVLARVTSSCTRLVDSIFKSHKEFQSSSILPMPVKKKK
jgi:ppGpp synthetase/RelA/SpoT-type nucleotidyltranferase